MKEKEFNQVSPKVNIILNILFMFFAACCIIPVIITISVSLSSEREILLNGFGVLPKQFTTSAYNFIFRKGNRIFDAYLVTMGVTAVGSFLSVLIVALFAYPLSRNDLKYKRFFTMMVLVAMLFNGGLVPWYIVCSKVVNITNSYYALFVPYLFNIWHVIIMRTFYKTTVPDSLIEAARIDGAGELRIFFQIVSPLCKAGYATIGLFTILIFWNDWWLSMILTTDKKFNTLQYFIYQVLTQASIIQQMSSRLDSKVVQEFSNNMPAETARFAMAIVAIGPILFIYPFFQKYFVKGITIGAVKG
jgi:putative aldouronate transport system permease protein